MNSKIWRMIYLAPNASELEGRIVTEFDRLYEDNGRPRGMALFSHTAFDGGPGISMTPESVRYCAPLLARYPWNEAVNENGFGYSGWLAGDERFKL